MTILKAKVTRIEEGDIPIIRNMVTSIDTRLANVEERELPNLRFSMSNIENNELPKMRKERTIDANNIARILTIQLKMQEQFNAIFGNQTRMKVL